jgi:Tol biopolymer transport system component
LDVALGACGFPRPADVGADDASARDAPTLDVLSAPRCDPAASFGVPMALTSLNTDADNEKADLSPDELTIYFASNRPGGAGGRDIYQATRVSASLPFGNVIPVTGVNTSGDELSPRVTADGLTMFATSRPVGAPFLHITLATRTSTAVSFGPLQVVATVNGTTNDADPFILAAGSVLYFSSDRGGSFGMYRSTKTGGSFSPPTIVSGVDLDSPNNDGTPVVAPDELALFFTSNRRTATNDFDIYMATRSTVADGFGEASALTSLNTTESETPSWISADGCALYFTRFEPSVGNQLYVSTRGR